MATWVVRGQKDGRHEERFLRVGAIYLTWADLDDLTPAKTRDEIRSLLAQRNRLREPAKRWKDGAMPTYTGVVYRFRSAMKQGDRVVLPRKREDFVRIGRITGDYAFDPSADPAYRHFRKVDWDRRDTARSQFSPEQLVAMKAQLQNFELPESAAFGAPAGS